MSGGNSFPAQAGQAFSIPQNSDGVSLQSIVAIKSILTTQAPNQLVFIPSDFSNTYVINHWTNPSSYASTDGSPYAANLINTTSIISPPTQRDANAAYAASYNALVQITTSGEIYYVNNAVAGGSAVAGASWTKMNYALTGGSVGSASAGSSGTTSVGASSTSSGASARQTSTTSSGSGTASVSSGAAAATSSRAAADRAISFGTSSIWGLVVLACAAAVGGLSVFL